MTGTVTLRRTDDKHRYGHLWANTLTAPEETTDPRAILNRPGPPPDITLRYGPADDHVADVRLPRPDPGSGVARRAPLVIFLHGGFWRTTYDRAHTAPLAAALAGAGCAVCTPEFRRVGEPGGGWPGTFDDVAAAVDLLPGLIETAAASVCVTSGPLVLAGHSAGGHLALWAAARYRLPPSSRWHTPAPGPYLGVVGLAAVSDLVACHEQRLGGSAADALIGGGPDRHPDRYALADPARLLPLGIPVRLVHGSRDDNVPCQMSRDYAVSAAAAGDDVVLDELIGCGHFEPIDPLSAAWPAVLAAFRAIAAAPAG
jgi:acetyl esterase/lipase